MLGCLCAFVVWWMVQTLGVNRAVAAVVGMTLGPANGLKNTEVQLRTQRSC